MKSIVIATRQSQLALWQANFVKQQLLQQHSDLQVELLGITTSGDQRQDIALQHIGGKGVFLKELQHALLDQRADIAVHSMKDVPNEKVAGLSIPVVCERTDARDAFVANDFAHFEQLPKSAVVGTASVRRSAQLLAVRPDLHIRLLRGNVNSRLQKLDQGEYDAIILAAAGLQRLGLNQRIRHFFPMDIMLPSVAQGAIGIECRTEDDEIQTYIASLNHTSSQQCVLAERAFTASLNGNCHSPIGVYAHLLDDQMVIEGVVASADGRRVLRDRLQAKAQIELGCQLAQRLIKQGALAIL